MNLFNKSVKGKKVAVGMSGGVDSSVAAYLLLKQGYDVTGVFMQCWDFKADGCRADEDRAFAVETAAKLGIKFETLDFREAYKAKVMNYFYNEYRLGRTPNPDVMCNKEIKFGIFFDWAKQNGFDFVATGHYARVKKDKAGHFDLLTGRDVSKDQSYFLYLLGQEQLSQTLFPVGDMRKTDLRKLAIKLNLPAAVRPDSMGICFIGEVDIREFLKKQIEPKVGVVKDIAGNTIGEHEGVWFYTVGQRHGFKLSTYVGHPLYVVSKDVEKNVLVVGTESDASTDQLVVNDVHWINQDPFVETGLLQGQLRCMRCQLRCIKCQLRCMRCQLRCIKCKVRIRHLGKFYDAVVCNDNGSPKVTLSKPAFAVASGQSAVFYDGTTVLGGGIIA